MDSEASEKAEKATRTKLSKGKSSSSSSTDVIAARPSAWVRSSSRADIERKRTGGSGSRGMFLRGESNAVIDGAKKRGPGLRRSSSLEETEKPNKAKVERKTVSPPARVQIKGEELSSSRSDSARNLQCADTTMMRRSMDKPPPTRVQSDPHITSKGRSAKIEKKTPLSCRMPSIANLVPPSLPNPSEVSNDEQRLAIFMAGVLDSALADPATMSSPLLSRVVPAPSSSTVERSEKTEKRKSHMLSPRRLLSGSNTGDSTAPAGTGTKRPDLVVEGPKTNVRLFSVPGGESLAIKHIACGKTHFVAVTLQGDTFSYGKGKSGQLGLGQDRLMVNELTKVEALDTVFAKKVSCYANTTAIISADRDLHVFGASYAKDKHDHCLWAPKLIPMPNKRKCQDVALGEEHFIAIVEAEPRLSAGMDGEDSAFGRKDTFSSFLTVASWGRGSQGQLGLGESVVESETPLVIPYFNEHQPYQVACGAYISAVVTKDGKLVVWGEVGVKSTKDEKKVKEDKKAKEKNPLAPRPRKDHSKSTLSPREVTTNCFVPTLVEIPPLSFICCGDRALVGAGLDDKVYQMNNQGDVEEVQGIPNVKVSLLGMSRNINLAACGPKIYAWGRNTFAFFHLPLPDPDSPQRDHAIELPDPFNIKAVEMCCAARACFFLREVHYFGEDPRILLRFEAGRKTPRVFATLVERLRDFTNVEGLFRVSPNLNILAKSEAYISRTADVPEQVLQEPHEMAALLKRFVQNLPVPLLQPIMADLREIFANADTPLLRKMFSIQKLMKEFMDRNETYARMTKNLFRLLGAVVKDPLNQMNCVALAVCWTPCIVGTAGLISINSEGASSNRIKLMECMIEYGNELYRDAATMFKQVVMSNADNNEMLLEDWSDTIVEACEVLSEDEIRTILQPVARKLSQLVKSREISQSDGIAVWNAYTVVLEYCLPKNMAVEKMISSLRRLWINGLTEAFQLSIGLISFFSDTSDEMRLAQTEVAHLVAELGGVGMQSPGSSSLEATGKATVGAGNRLLRISVLDDPFA